MWEALLGKHHAVVTPVGTPQAPALLVSAPGPHTVQNGTQVLTQGSVQTWGGLCASYIPLLAPVGCGPGSDGWERGWGSGSG